MKAQGTIRSVDQLVNSGLVKPSEAAALAQVANHFAIALTPAMASALDPEDPDDPVRAQFIPTPHEMAWLGEEREDPISDHAYSPVAGLVHRYPDRVLLKPLLVCPVYCRFCFRREMVGPGAGALTDEALDKALSYIRSTPSVWEVVISGGDPLIMSTRRIRYIMEQLNGMGNVGVVRFHTRVPVVKPEAITDELTSALKISKATYVVLHTNHANELSTQARAACAKLIDAGIPMLSQTVLLNGVNADTETLKRLFRALVELRIKPYYLHHGDLAKGTKHFRTSITEGRKLVGTLRGVVSGLCQPLYVLDIPGGHGKVPLGPNYVRDVDVGAYDISDYRGNVHRYRDVVGEDRPAYTATFNSDAHLKDPPPQHDTTYSASDILHASTGSEEVAP
jgi:lysine 2,3-aminomutase